MFVIAVEVKIKLSKISIINKKISETNLHSIYV